jgi:hypothetical protein
MVPVMPLFAFPPTIRKMIYTTNAVESLNRSLPKIIKTRGSFPTDEAALKRHRQLIEPRSAGLRRLATLVGGLHRSSKAADFCPDPKSLRPGGSVLGRSDVIAGEMEQVVNLIVGCEEALGLAGRFELLHLPLSSACRLVRVLRSVLNPLCCRCSMPGMVSLFAAP